MSKWDDFRLTTSRLHSDFFGDTRYLATFYSWDTGTYDPSAGSMTGQTRTELATKDVEIVPPSQDSSVDVDGTNFSWTTSIRFPISGQDLTVDDTYTVESGTTDEFNDVTVESGATLTVNGTLIVYGTLTVNGTLDDSAGTVTIFGTATLGKSIVPLGEDNKKPTEVELTNQADNDSEVFELHSYTTEVGSGLLMCRLVEQ